MERLGKQIADNLRLARPLTERGKESYAELNESMIRWFGDAFKPSRNEGLEYLTEAWRIQSARALAELALTHASALQLHLESQVAELKLAPTAAIVVTHEQLIPVIRPKDRALRLLLNYGDSSFAVDFAKRLDFTFVPFGPSVPRFCIGVLKGTTDPDELLALKDDLVQPREIEFGPIEVVLKDDARR